MGKICAWSVLVALLGLLALPGAEDEKKPPPVSVTDRRLDEVVRRTLTCLPRRMAHSGDSIRKAIRHRVEALVGVDDATWSAEVALIVSILNATVPGASREAYERYGDATTFDRL